MTLEILQKEMVQALKNKDKFRKVVISGMIDAVKKASMAGKERVEITEELVDKTLLKYKKMTQESIDTCPADRVETLAEYVRQMDIVREFVPELLTDPVIIEQIVNEVVSREQIVLTKSNRGNIMRVLSVELKGKADMSIVSKVVGGLLQ